MFLDLDKNLGTSGPPPPAPHGAPGPPSRVLPLKIRSGTPCLLIVTDFKPFLELPVMFLIVVKIWEPMVPPQGAPSPTPSRGVPLKIPSGAHAYLLWHVGYQFYSDFSKENESRDDTTLF